MSDHHDPPDPDNEDLGTEDDEELDGDEGEVDESGDKGEAEPKVRARAARAPRAATASETSPIETTVVADPSPRGAPPASVGPAPRKTRVGTWLELGDNRLDQLTVLDRNNRAICSLRRPFPTHPEHWLASTYGIGRYRIVQKDDRGRHLGSRTVHVNDPSFQRAASTGTQAAPPNGNGSHAPRVAEVPPGTDYRLALVTVGLPILAEAIKAIAQRPQHSELETLIQAAKILNTPNEERTKLVREGMQLYRELSESAPREGSGDLFNVRDILSGVGELLRQWRQPAPSGSPAAPLSANPVPQAKAAAPAGELQAASGETAEIFVERVIVAEIQRAVGSGDSPECLVILIESWLPSPVVSWLEQTDDDQVLEELPNKFPAHADYLRQTGVQEFLRSALQMLREDPDDEGAGTRRPIEEVPRVREHAIVASEG